MAETSQDSGSLVELSKLLHTQCEHPHEILTYLDHARWAPLRKERWDGDVRIASGEIVENDGVGENLRECYHMDLAPDASWIVDEWRGPRVRFADDDDEGYY